jgi:amino acid transporter
MISNKSPSSNSAAPSEKDEKALRLNPELTRVEIKHGTRLGDVFARVRVPRTFRRVGPGHFVATTAADMPHSKAERSFRVIKRFFIGRPLLTSEESRERLSVLKGLAIFGSDAISSSAYATEAALLILLAAGNAALHFSLDIAVAVAAVFAIVVFSYRQTVYAYPQGGGSYNVSRENLGQIPGLIAASALLIDYMLTVAVSFVAGVQAIISALIVTGYGTDIDALTNALPSYLNPIVILSLFFIGFMVIANLRGVRESGNIFAIPTYAFIFIMLVMLVVGLYKALTGTLEPATLPPIVLPVEPLTLWLVLRAFTAGAVAMTGTEAVSNGVPAFKPPESKNAARTLTLMAILLGSFFLGISYLATHMHLVPGQETIISQTGLAVFGKNIFYYILQIATMGILVVAANTAFADFPRLSSVLARDGYMPRQFQYRGDRLAFSTGIMALGIAAALLVVSFKGSVGALINLYSIGVFLAFSMSNSGMVVHWLKTRGAGWRKSALINGIGAMLTAIILVVAMVTKFTAGGWIVIILSPAIVVILLAVHRHYDRVAEQLHIVPEQLPSQEIEQLVLVPIDDVNYASLRAFAFARSVNAEIVAIHVSASEAETQKLRDKMHKYASDLHLVVIDSPTRAFTQPLMAYIDAVHRQQPEAFITIVLPEFITAHIWERLLHNRTAQRLIHTFEKHPNVTVVLVPYLLER